MKNLLLLSGGGGTEHDVSLVSVKHIENTLAQLPRYNVFNVVIDKDKKWKLNSEEEVALTMDRKLLTASGEVLAIIDGCIPCIHGPPGETGDLQSMLELMGIPYMGVGPEASKLCFNKISTKLWLDALGIPNTPYRVVTKERWQKDRHLLDAFFKEHKALFVKASSQGSSVGCYPANTLEELPSLVDKAFALSPFVIVEKKVIARELELSAFEYQGQVHTSLPGEISCPDGFYSFEEKYAKESQTTTLLEAPHLSPDQIERLRFYAREAFVQLGLRHLSRIDFFLTKEGDLYLNEINTFPGMTPISMFPKMMEHAGTPFVRFLEDTLQGMMP